MALISKKKKNTILYILILILVIPFFFLFLSTPGLKGDLEQGLRIFFKQPILLKTSSRNNSILDNSKKIIYAFQNKLLSKNNFELIKISVPFDQLKILREERKKALDKKKLINPKKINVDIFYKNKKYAATARLKGDLSEHWGNIKQWSLRIKLKKKETILNMNEFSISVHSERNFPYNFLIYKTMKNYNLLTPKYYTLKVNFNGNDWGLMLAEEQFSDSFYELNQIKKAPIFKMTNENDFLIAKLAIGNFENIDDIIKWQGKFETKIYNKKKF